MSPVKLVMQIWILIAVVATLSGCSDSNNSSDTPLPPPPNTTVIVVTLDSTQVINGGSALGSAEAEFTLDLDNNMLTGILTLTDITASAVTLNLGFAGERGTVLFNLNEDSTTQWSLPVSSSLTAQDLEQINSGGIYLQVENPGEPNGALRGQLITGNIQLIFTSLSSTQEVPPVTSSGSASGAITLDPDSGAIVIHVNASGLDDAVASHVHQALAGVNGGVTLGLLQDSANVSHWFAENVTLDAAQMEALNAGELYLNLHTPANPGGEVRGQIQPEGIEIFFTTLSGADVVPPVTTVNTGIAATTIITSSQVANLHVNLQGLDDASGVRVYQAPVGQNGPEVLAFLQDISTLSHWALENLTLTNAQYTALRNQGLYISVISPSEPNGEIRGQLEPAMSAPGTGTTFVVSAINPSNGGTVDALPTNISVTFNRDILSSTVTLDRVSLLASGGDGSFNNGNELSVNAVDAVASGAMLNLDFTGAVNADDVYQLTLDGSSATPLTDTDGVVVDGDNDGNAGGDFVSTFTVAIPAGPSITLTSLQTDIFTPSCAVSGCHTGASPAQGLNLSAGLTFSNTVGVASNEVPGLNRVESANPDNSYLVQKVEGTASVGARMPFGQPALSNTRIQQIRDWITDGAMDN